MTSSPIHVLSLGQSGFRLTYGDAILYVDPYLTDHVAELEGDHMRRQHASPLQPDETSDASAVFVTHAHPDHCDPTTLTAMAAAAPNAVFTAPVVCHETLAEAGVPLHRVAAPVEEWATIMDGVRVRAVPAAHPAIARDQSGNLAAVGYVFEFNNRRLYHAGDCSPESGLIEILQTLAPIDIAFLPVNERNFFREQRGIIGNMSVREAFAVASAVGARILVPMHWDLFRPNSTHREEIELLYRLERPPFALRISPTEV